MSDDGFVVEQCRVKMRKISGHAYDCVEVWQEVAFFRSWALGDPAETHDADLAEADAEWDHEYGKAKP